MKLTQTLGQKLSRLFSMAPRAPLNVVVTGQDGKVDIFLLGTTPADDSAAHQLIKLVGEGSYDIYVAAMNRKGLVKQPYTTQDGRKVSIDTNVIIGSDSYIGAQR